MPESITLYHPDTSSDYFHQIQSELEDLGLHEGRHYQASEDIPEDIDSDLNPNLGILGVENSTLGEIYHSLSEAKTWARKTNLDKIREELEGEA